MGREARARAAKRAAQGSVNLQLPPMGLPGEPGRVMVHNVFAAGDPRATIPVGGGHGSYRVVFTMARPGYRPVAEREFSFEPNIEGDSHLAIGAPALALLDRPAESIVAMHIATETRDGRIQFVCRPNKKGFLGRVEAELTANDLLDAERRAYRALAPALSNWSVQLDIPLLIWRSHVTSIETGVVQISVRNPFIESAPPTHATSLSPEYRGFASLYREALESNSPVYQFLCLFKIAEGLRKRRGRRAKQAKEDGASCKRPIERVPADPEQFDLWLKELFPAVRHWDPMSIESIFLQAARGRKFGDLLGHELKDLRDEVAHALSDVTGVMTVTADEVLHVDRVNQWIPITKCIVRRMLKNEFPEEFPSQAGA